MDKYKDAYEILLSKPKKVIQDAYLILNGEFESDMKNTKAELISMMMYDDTAFGEIGDLTDQTPGEYYIEGWVREDMVLEFVNKVESGKLVY